MWYGPDQSQQRRGYKSLTSLTNRHKTKAMKATIKITLLLVCSFFMLSITPALAGGDFKTDTFKVYGNCEMCKATIESSLKKKDGIIKKSWSPETKIMKVTYDPSKITLHEIKEKIAAVGYDTDEVKGNDEAYDKLHPCCQYERANK